MNVIIPYFINMVATQFNCSIKDLRSGNAKEFALTEFLTKKGVLHQLSCVNRPQRNSGVEMETPTFAKCCSGFVFPVKNPSSILE